MFQVPGTAIPTIDILAQAERDRAARLANVASAIRNRFLAPQEQAATQISQARAQTEPQSLAATLQAQQLANQLTAARAPTAAPLAAAELKLAQTKAASPFAGQILPGPAGQAQGVAILEKRFGANSPIVLMAKRIQNNALNMQEARAHFYNANYYLKNMPNIVKTQQALAWQEFNAKRQQEGSPTMTFQDWFQTVGQRQLTPEQQKQVPGVPKTGSMLPLSTENEANPGAFHAPDALPVMHATALSTPADEAVRPEENVQNFGRQALESQAVIQKLTSDPKTRAKALNFQTINEMMGGVDTNLINYYTGPKGLARIAEDRAATLNGQNIPRFERYNAFINVTMPTLADKIRQAYQTSIDPSMFKILISVANPITWKNSPRVAIAQWKKVQQFMREQGAIYNRALGAPIRATATGALPGAAPIGGGSAPSQENLEETARLHGLTVAQVRQRLGIQ